MSSRAQSKPVDALPLGTWLRQLRKTRHLTIRAVAAIADMDTAHLSKIELGQRLPTETQTATLARFFAVPTEEMQARRIVDKFWNDHRDTPAAHRAASVIAARTRSIKQRQDD